MDAEAIGMNLVGSWLQGSPLAPQERRTRLFCSGMA